MGEFTKLLWGLTSRSIRFRIGLFALGNFIFAVLDILALFLFAKIFASVVNEDHSFITQFLNVIRLQIFRDKLESEYAASIFIVVFLVLLKSVGSLLMGKIILDTLSSSYQVACEKMTKSYFDQPLTAIKSRPSYEVFLAVNSGVRDIYITGIYSAINAIVEIGIVVLIFIVIIIQGGLPSFSLALFFIAAFVLISKTTGKSIKRHSEALSNSNLDSAVVIQTIVEAVRETRVFNTLSFFLRKQQASVKNSAESTVALQYVGYIPKVIMESTFMIGIAAFTLFLILTGNMNKAIVEVGFIVAMGSRIIPSLLRLQFNLNQLKQVKGSSTFTRSLLQEPLFVQSQETNKISKDRVSPKKSFSAILKIHELSYFYPNMPKAALHNLSLEIQPGESLGIVGRSGSGKSTFLDILCGGLLPSHGSVSISGLPISQVLTNWEGRLGFVPQNVPIIDGTLRENLLLGRSAEDFSELDFERALNFAAFFNFAPEGTDFLNYRISRAGSELSGGQRQKLGIARALLANPDILILDEVTSSLDAESENTIGEAIKLLEGKVTLIVVAHRLKTVKDLQKIILMENGEIVASGNFDTLFESNETFKTFVNFSLL